MTSVKRLLRIRLRLAQVLDMSNSANDSSPIDEGLKELILDCLKLDPKERITSEKIPTSRYFASYLCPGPRRQGLRLRKIIEAEVAWQELQIRLEDAENESLDPPSTPIDGAATGEGDSSHLPTRGSSVGSEVIPFPVEVDPSEKEYEGARNYASSIRSENSINFGSEYGKYHARSPLSTTPFSTDRSVRSRSIGHFI
jgi:serine/threonine protein kinase